MAHTNKPNAVTIGLYWNSQAVPVANTMRACESLGIQDKREYDRINAWLRRHQIYTTRIGDVIIRTGSGDDDKLMLHRTKTCNVRVYDRFGPDNSYKAYDGSESLLSVIGYVSDDRYAAVVRDIIQQGWSRMEGMIFIDTDLPDHPEWWPESGPVRDILIAGK